MTEPTVSAPVPDTPVLTSLQKIKKEITDGVAKNNAILMDDDKKDVKYLDASELVATPPVEGTNYAVFENRNNGQYLNLGSDYNEIKINDKGEVEVGINQQDTGSYWNHETIDMSSYNTETPTHLVFKLTPLSTTAPAVSGGKRKRTHRKRHGKLRKTRRRHRRPAH